MASSSHQIEPIRLAVLSALRFRKLGPFTLLLAEIARSDEMANVRRAAIDVLGRGLGELPALRTVLEDVKAHDELAKHRALAARYLEASRGT